LGTFPTPPSDGPYGVAFDGTYIWVSGDSNVLVLRASDGAQVAVHQLQTEGVAFDGSHVWMSEQTNNRIHKF
jgi:hypothetical protein